MKSIRNLKIVFVAGILGPGGAERQLFYILKALRGLGCDISLVSLTQGQFWEKPIRKLGIPVLNVGDSQNRLLKLKHIIAHIKQLKPDIVQSQHFYTNLYAAFAGRLLRVTDIGAVRGNGAYELHQNGALLGRLCLYMPRYIAANSMAGKKFAKKIGVPSQRLRFLPNVVDTNLFTPVRKRILKKPVTLLLISNLHLREKRVDFFIQVVAQLNEKNKHPISVLIVGDGPLKVELKAMAKDYGIYPGVLQFVGTTNHIENVYKQADILVLTSDSEGTPNVIIEAMASGLPVVATEVGGVPDIVRDGITGFLVQPGDEPSFVAHLANLIENPELRSRMGKMGREYIMANHSLEQLPNILTEFYSSIFS